MKVFSCSTKLFINLGHSSGHLSFIHLNVVSGIYSSFAVEQVDLGLHSLSERDPSSVRVKVVEVIVHPDYESVRGDDPNDIMLLKLEHPVNFTANVTPICIPDPGYEIAEGRRCYSTGWGALKCKLFYITKY